MTTAPKMRYVIWDAAYKDFLDDDIFDKKNNTPDKKHDIVTENGVILYASVARKMCRGHISTSYLHSYLMGDPEENDDTIKFIVVAYDSLTNIQGFAICGLKILEDSTRAGSVIIICADDTSFSGGNILNIAEQHCRIKLDCTVMTLEALPHVVSWYLTRGYRVISNIERGDDGVYYNNSVCDTDTTEGEKGAYAEISRIFKDELGKQTPEYRDTSREEMNKLLTAVTTITARVIYDTTVDKLSAPNRQVVKKAAESYMTSAAIETIKHVGLRKALIQLYMMTDTKCTRWWRENIYYGTKQRPPIGLIDFMLYQMCGSSMGTPMHKCIKTSNRYVYTDTNKTTQIYKFVTYDYDWKDRKARFYDVKKLSNMNSITIVNANPKK